MMKVRAPPRGGVSPAEKNFELQTYNVSFRYSSPIVEDLVNLHRAAHAPVGPDDDRFHEHLFFRGNAGVGSAAGADINRRAVNRNRTPESGFLRAAVGIDAGRTVELDEIAA